MKTYELFSRSGVPSSDEGSMLYFPKQLKSEQIIQFIHHITQI